MKTLFWDFDGTLAFRKGLWSGAVVNVANRHRPEKPTSVAEVKPFLATGFPWHKPDQFHGHQSASKWWQNISHLFTNAFIQIGFRETDARELANEVRIEYLRLDSWQLYEDVIPCLTNLSELGWRHIIVSNHVPELPDLIDQLELKDYFSEIVSSAAVGYEKPNPKIFQHALELTSNPKNVWMIGDSLSADIEGAKAVGIPAIHVRKKASSAIYQATSLDSLIELLD